MATPHNTAQPGEIAPICLMPGDPLRAKFIAETYLENPKCFNQVRGMLGYTGTYQGKPISVMGHGMGMASVGIYSYELYAHYGVETIIRIGSIGGFEGALNLVDIILAQGACTDSNFAAQYQLPGTFAPIGDFQLLMEAAQLAQARQQPVSVGNVISSDVFYQANADYNAAWEKMGVLGVEMECAALYMNAAFLGKKALGILTVSDILGNHAQVMTPEERQHKLSNMIELALTLASRQTFA